MTLEVSPTDDTGQRNFVSNDEGDSGNCITSGADDTTSGNTSFMSSPEHRQTVPLSAHKEKMMGSESVGTEAVTVRTRKDDEETDGEYQFCYCPVWNPTPMLVHPLTSLTQNPRRILQRRRDQHLH